MTKPVNDSLHLEAGHSLAKQWASLGPPLRPSREDLRLIETAAGSFLESFPSTDAKVMVLGVTPELCQLALPGVASVTAVDRSAEMIQGVWPGPSNPRDLGIQSSWDQIPLESDSLALILSDGSFPLRSCPEGQEKVFAEMHRLLLPGGRCIARCFLKGEALESPADVFRDLGENRIGSFHILKWRLAMALQVSPEEGVALHSVWETLTTELPDPLVLAKDHLWKEDEIGTIAHYRNSTTRYSFPTLQEQRQVAESCGFRLVAQTFPGYELGECFPTLVFECVKR